MVSKKSEGKPAARAAAKNTDSAPAKVRAVASDAATQLTISTFDFLGKDPAIGRAGALSRAMGAYLNDAPDEKHANPAYWGPFSVVGEGTVK